MEKQIAYKAKVLMFDFGQKVFEGQRSNQEKSKLIAADFLGLNFKIAEANKTAIETYLRIWFEKLKSHKAVIEQIKTDQEILIAILPKEQINKLFETWKVKA